MSQARLTLDNEIFDGTLRYKQRSVAYVPRPVQKATIQDVVRVRTRGGPRVSTVSKDVPKPAPSHPDTHVFMDVKPTAHTHRRQHAKHHAAQRAATIQPRPTAQKHRRPIRLVYIFRRQSLMYAGAVLVFALGLYVSFSGLYANKRVAVQVQTLQKQAVKGAATGSTDETVPPSTEKPSAAAVRGYAVSPLNPRYIDIPKLKVHSRVLAMTVDRKNELQAPYGIYDAGWYNASSHPGENGAMLIDGHSGIGSTHGIFHDLTKLVAGDPITIKRGDGQVFTYKVVDVKVQDVGAVDMGNLLVSADTAKPGLNLITCAGDQIPGTFSLKQRVVVRAVMN
jgi:LPXTG-site transpeptidase (sortase) family protein